MNHQKLELYFLLIFIFTAFSLVFFIFKPFLYALILAIVFSVIFNPVYKKALIVTRGKNGLAALLSIISVLAVVILPVAFLSVQIFNEATWLFSFIKQNENAINLPNTIKNYLQNTFGFSLPLLKDFSFDFNKYLGQGLSWLLQYLGFIFTNITKILISFFIFLIAIYYSFKDGQKLKKAVIDLIPLRNIYGEMILDKLSLAINSIIKGNLMIAIIQGVLTAIGFIIFGVPNATLWGTVAAITALIPGIGTSLVLIPAILYLFFTKELFFAAGLLIWGITAVGLIDNFLGPKLVGRGMNLHSFFVLLSVLGGISFFGPLGFLFGPLALCLLFALFEVYFSIYKEYEKRNLN